MAGALALLIAGRAAAQPQPLWVLDVRGAAAGPIAPDRPLRVRLDSRAPAALAARLEGVVGTGADHVIVDLTPGSRLGGAASVRGPTFLVDYDEASVVALREALVARHGPAPRDEELAAFVRALLDVSWDRGFDVASQVARHRSGDCTEHAVLLTALARAVGIPAQVVVGTVIVRSGERVAAYGHAWVELHREAGWSIVDATPLGGDVPLSYVPEGLLEDEGPGFMFGFLSSLASGILRVEVLGNAPAPAGP